MYQMDEWICPKLIIFDWIVLDLYPFYYVWFALLVDKDKPLTLMVGCMYLARYFGILYLVLKEYLASIQGKAVGVF